MSTKPPIQSHAEMISATGSTPGKTCADCLYLVVGGSRSRSNRSSVAITHSCRVYERDVRQPTVAHPRPRAVVWTRKWAACGRFKSAEC